MEEIKIDHIIYMDVEFIALKYEEITGEISSSMLTRAEGGTVGLNIPIFSAGVHTQETRTYKLSSFGMLKKILDRLGKDYSSFNKDLYGIDNKPQIAWVQSHITISEWRSQKNKDEKYPYFQLLEDKYKYDFSLVSKNEYISSGYASLFGISPALQNGIDIPVSCLIKVLYYSTVGKSFVSVPFLIVER